MLNELESMQESDESVWAVEMSFDVESRTEDSGELVHKIYTFSWVKEWEKWTFVEYLEKRTKDTKRVSERDWRKARHIMWHEVDETPTIDVPPEISEALADATGADSVVIQPPSGSE